MPRLIDGDELLDIIINKVEDDEEFRIDYYIDDNTVDAIIIPKDATNGDMMKLMFPNMRIEEHGELFYGIIEDSSDYGGFNFDMKAYWNWWNALYKKGE